MAKKLARDISRRSMVNRSLTAAGALFISANTKRGLFLLRDQDTYSDTWGLVGGQIEGNETLYEGLTRETKEEIGFVPTIIKIIPILSSEHKGYAWCDLSNTPKPLHPGLYNSLSNNIIKEKIDTIKNLLEITE